MMHLPETIWRDGEQPGIPDISSYSADQEDPSQPHLVKITCTGSWLTVKLKQEPTWWLQCTVSDAVFYVH